MPPISSRNGLMEILGRYPSFWPLLMLLLLMPAMAMLAQPGMKNTFPVKHWKALGAAFGMACVSLFIASDLANLFFPGFHDYYESAGVSLGYALFHGGQIYPALDSGEYYSLPYGPIFYAIIGLSQWFFGATVFAAKLPSSLAPLLALGVFWTIIRGQGAGRSLSWVMLGLLSALLLAIRHASFWTKTDPLILLVVILGSWVALRPNQRWSPLLGLCAGLAMGLKLSALAYFLPIFVLAWLSGWRWRAFTVVAGTLGASCILPFVLFPQQISFTHYLSFLQLVAKEGFSLHFGANYLRWFLMLMGLVIVFDRCVIPLLPQSAPKAHGRLLYRWSILAGFAIIAVPASVVGAGPNHHIPFIPLVLLACGNLIRPAVPKVTWSNSVPLLWRSSACAILLACLLIALKHTVWIAQAGMLGRAAVEACLADLLQIRRQHPDHKILMGSGSASDCLQTRLRHELIFAGHPIGFDTSVVSDFQLGGAPPPRLDLLLAEINERDHRPPLWVLPRGEKPFTSFNGYNPIMPVYPESFRQEFHGNFVLKGQTAYFDFYLGRTSDPVLATENLRNAEVPAKPPG